MNRLRIFTLSLGLILPALLVLTGCPNPEPETPSLTVHFIDVGQGDAILIDSGQTEILIDGGEKSPGVVDYLQRYVDGPLEAMIATHPHADHIGGLLAVLEDYSVSDIWWNGDNATSKTFVDYMNLANAEQAGVHEAERGNSIIAGDLTLVVLSPTKPLSEDTNRNSIVVSLSFGDTDFLFTGDADSQAEAGMLDITPDVEVLKVGHHGSRYSSSPEFLALARPEVAVYCAAVGNSYHHPHAETIVALNQIGAAIYGTDVSGTITVTTDGKTYSVQTEK